MYMLLCYAEILTELYEFVFYQKHSYDTNDFIFVCSKKKDLS